MIEAVSIPSWAVGAFVAVLLATVGLATWGLKALGARMSGDIASVKQAVADASAVTDKKIGGVSTKVHEIDKRLVRIETIVNGENTNPALRAYPRALTPPIAPGGEEP